MLTSPNTARAVRTGDGAISRDGRPAYRPFAVTVTRVRSIGSSFRRVTLTGEGLEWFSTHGQDQRVKLLFPLGDGHLTDVGAHDPDVILNGTWYERWRSAPESRRSPLRTYTVRAVRPEHREVDVDMVIHGDAGPASRWARRAEAGDRLVLIGPDARSTNYASGADWAPGDAGEVLLAGDETAAPAICSILEDLPPHRRARAFIEVPTAGDVLDVHAASTAEISWLVRGERAHGAELIPAVRSWIDANAVMVNDVRAVARQALDEVDVDTELLWDSPVLQVQPIDSCGRGERCGSDFYAWFAGEAGVIKTLRRMLVKDVGVCRRRVAFMGYWRLGRSEGS